METAVLGIKEGSGARTAASSAVSASGDSWAFLWLDDTESEKSLFGMEKWLYVDTDGNDALVDNMKKLAQRAYSS